MNLQKVDHVAIAVADLAEPVRLFHDIMGGRFLAGGDNDDTGIRLIHLALGGFKLELLQPLRADCILQRHLDRRGPGFHHMTFFVEDLPTSIDGLATEQVGVTGTDLSSPRWRETFIDPAASFGTLLQIVESERVWDEPTPGLTLDDVLHGRAVWLDYEPCLRDSSATLQT